MNIFDFDYELPEALIAQQPLADRAASRMLVAERPSGKIHDSEFSSLRRFLRPDDTLVLNNTKVFPARLLGASDTGAKVEVFLVREVSDGIWHVLARPAKRLPIGKKIIFDKDLEGEIVEKLKNGQMVMAFTPYQNLSVVIDKIGKTPLPPYIKRGAERTDHDRERYQTVFAKSRGAIAAPTAGLHFTPTILEQLRGAGVTICEITLHVGYGTFEPVRVDDLSLHQVMPEEYEIDEPTAESLNRAKKDEKRIVAVGTTTTRTLEDAMRRHGRFVAEKTMAELTIIPGFKFEAVDALLTNFHLPRSSLLVLVSTFAGHELTMAAYRHAVGSRYRFYSYGDCMLII
jgi:S-adenosylmethionine:tRNA ribosyltransferase-isomerase